MRLWERSDITVFFVCVNITSLLLFCLTVPETMPVLFFATTEQKKLGKNWHIAPSISECTGHIFTKFSWFVDTLMLITKLTFVLRLLMEVDLWPHRVC